MRKMLMLIVATLMSLAAFADVTVTSVTAKQRYPWNGLVDVYVGLSGSSDELFRAEWSFVAKSSATQASLSVTKIRQAGGDVGSGMSWTRHFIWDAASDLGEVKIDDIALTVDAFVGVQLWENGPYWAECNVGASKPEECGYCFCWGDTVGCERNAANEGWVSVQDDTMFIFDLFYCPTYGKSNFQLQSAGCIDASGNLVAAHDAATAHLGTPWRMPTDAEFTALINNCTTTWDARNGVYGRLVSGKGAYASKSIFLPAAGCGRDSILDLLNSGGYYWSSTPYSGYPTYAWSMYFNSSDFLRGYHGRSLGMFVRPLRGYAEVDGISFGAVITHLPIDGRNFKQGLRQADLDSTLTIEYSPDFADVGGNKAVRVLLNGEVWVESVVSGSKTFTFEEAGLYQFTHQVLVNGAVADSMTVTYAVAPQGHIAIPDTWTEIPNDFFENCDWLSSVEIPPSVSNIAATAFTGCVNITNVVLHSSASVSRLEPKFAVGTKWVEVEEALNGDKVFKSNDVDYRQSTAIEFDIPIGLGELVFSWKVHPESNEGFKWYLDGVSKWLLFGRGWNVVSNALDVGTAHRVKFVYSNDGYTNYEPGSCVYVSIRGLSKRPDVLKKIFPDSPVLSVTIGDEVDELSDGFFADCTTLESVSLPNILTTIGGDTFMGCSSLAAIAIPSGVTNIGENAFLGCENLKRVDVASLDDWLKIGFANPEANPLSSGAKLCIGGANVTNILIPNGTTRIEACAFTGGDFTSVTIPSSVMNIGEDAFMRCENLKRVDVATLEDWQKIQFVNEGANPLGCGAELYVGGKRCVCRIDFDMNCDVSGPASMERSPRAFYGTLPTPERDGGLFLGWYTAPEGGERVSKEWVVDGDRTLYAHWVVVSDVKVFSGYPWQEVVIGYTITGKAEHPMAIDIEAKDYETGNTYGCKTLEGVDFTPGCHFIKWNASADGVKFKSDKVVFTVRAAIALYCVIDLSGGTSATSYSVTGLVDVPSDGWTDEYKTTKLVLRRIEAGTFMMGGASESDNSPHQVTLTKPFYIGVFEVTQRQWELVMGTKPAYFSNAAYYATRPVEKVSYKMIRGSLAGADWPLNNAVDATSFIGKLRAKTGLDFDLPTDAQWEYACRAGTKSTYNNGGSVEDDLKQLGRYWDNGGSNSSSSCSPLSGTAKVGSYLQNAWGLYDMHGNVWEWCIDWFDSNLGAELDPKGADSGSGRVIRGGGWAFVAGNCTSSYRYFDIPSSVSSYYGFRLFCPIQEDGNSDADVSEVVFATASSTVVSVDTTFADGTDIKLWNALPIAFAPFGLSGICSIDYDGEEFLRTNECGVCMWNPGADGSYVLTLSSRDISMSSLVEFSSRIDIGDVRNGATVITDGATSISEGAFANRDDLVSVSIPKTVTNIAATAFSGCSNITSVVIPASVNAASVFEGSKTKIARVTITAIGTVPPSAYSGCTALIRVDVDSLADWMALSFANTEANPLSTGAKLYVGGTEVAELIVPEGTTEICAYAFAGGSFSSVAIPSSVTNVAATAFSRCVNITSGVVPANMNVANVFADSKTNIARVTITGTGTVPASAYSGCSALTHVEVASLADWMALSFANTEANPLSTGAKLYVGGTEVAELIVPEGTTEICAYAFAEGAFSSVAIPSSVTNVAATAFSGCTNITSVVVPPGLNVANVFADSKTKIARVTITGTGTVPASAYSGCTALSRVDVASLADWLTLSFANAEANPLSTGAKLYVDGKEVPGLIIPEGTMEIGAYAFAGGAVSLVTIPSSVTNIAATAFSGCSNIVDVTMGCGTMMSLDRPQFEGDWIELGDNQYKSRAIGGSQSSSLSTIVEVGCERIVKFRWSVSSESGCDYLRVFVDDVKKDEISGSRDWKEVSLNLAMGRHVIRWTYSKDGSLASGADCGWVDVSELVVPCASTLAEIFPNSYAHIRTLTLLDGVTRLPSDLLTGCIALTSVTMPTSISSVGAGAFSDCTALTRVEVASIEDWLSLSFANAEANPLSTGAKLYVDGTEVTGLIVTEGTTKIGAYAFAGGMFSSITIPLSVTDIAATAFSGCTNITSVSVPASLNVASVFSDSKTKITSVAITGTGTVPASAYSGCTALTRVEVASLADWLSLSFANAAANPLSTGAKLYVDGTEVTGLIVTEGTTKIGAYAFAGGAFSSVSIPNSVTNVEATAFAGCKNITSVAVPASMSVATVFADSKTNIARVTITGTGTVPASAYSGCTALTHVEVASLEDWLALSFANAAANPLSTGAKLYVGGSEVTNLVIPSGTTSIGNYAFAGAAFTSVTIPPSVTNIAETAFAGCKNIESVYVPSWMKVSELFASSLGVLREAVLVNVGGQIVESAFVGCTALREITIPEGTTKIAAKAFKGCASLARVSLPVSLKTIGVNAFAGCTAIVAVTCPALGRLAEIFPASFSKIADVTIAPGPARLPDGLFAGCTALRRLELPDGITVVGPGAFAGCSGLRNLVLPDSVSRFEVGAFDECPTLESITPPAGLVDFRLADIPLAVRKSWGLEYDADGFIVWNGILVDYAYKDASEIVIPEEVVVIGGEALAGMADLESVVWPSALKRIGMGAFASDTYLDNLAIPDTVETICEDAFADCSYLQTLTMGRGVKTVLDRAFKGCTQLAAVRFHPGLVSIGSEAFGGCWRMKSVGLPLSVAAVAEDAFTGCDDLDGLTMPTHHAPLSSWFKPVYRQIAAVTVPVGETDVIADMFDGCLALVELELPEGVTNIGSRACRDCLKLAVLTVPSTVAEIGEEAFRGCEALEAIVLQSGVERIGAAAFRDCLRLKDVTLSASLTVLPKQLFAGCRALDSLTVPKGVSSLGADFVSSWTTEVYYLGDAPAFDENAYRGADMALTSYVINGTKGWDGRPTSRDLPESWPVGNAYARSIKTWTTVRYDVTFDAGSGIFAPVSSNAYACEESVGSVYAIPPYEPRLAGMKFDGWWTEPEAGSRITANTLVVLQKAHTLYAHWKSVPTIRVRFNACGGTVMPGEDSYAVGEPFGYFPEPTREHYAFAGWYDRAEGGREVLVSHEVPGADVELFAHWTPCLYILRLHANNGTAAACDQLFTYGETVTILDYETLRSRHGFDAPQGRTFAGWAVSPGGAAVYADAKTLAEVGDIEDGVIHLWACWSSGRYSVRFDSHGGTGRMDDQTFQIGVPQALIKNRYVRDGFLFGGWALTTDSDAAYADGDVVKDLTTVKDATVSLYAVWVRQSGTSIVTFELNGGTLEPSHAERTSGAAFGTLPVPTRTGYTFARWTLRDGTTVTASSIVPQTDVTLYAVWLPIGYSIVFDANGGTGTIDAINCVYGQEYELPARGFAWEGHVFKGWSTDANGEVEHEPGAIVKNLTGSDNGVIRLYAVWEPERPVAPVITPAGGTVFMSDSCMVSISCATEGAIIYCSTTAVPRPTAGNVYSAPFAITETTTVYAFAVRGGRQSATVSATITKRRMSLAESVGAPELTVATGGAAAWCPVADESVDEDGVSARSGQMEAAAAAGGNESWMEVSVNGAGTLAFWWRVDCEDDGPGTVTWDRLMYLVDGVEQERIDGWTDWERRTVEFSTPGEHKVRWTYHKDDYDDPLFPGEDCGWIDRVSWTPSATPEPSVAGDAGATVTGDAENGFVVTPSAGRTVVEVTIPAGFDAAKVTVEVAVTVERVKPNGAKVKVVSGGADITEFLDLPAADKSGTVDLSQATVKAEIVREALDPKQGAEIKLDPANPTLTTANTRKGLTYTLYEGEALEGMKAGDSTLGDGQPWTPRIEVKGGASAFYTIGVGK